MSARVSEPRLVQVFLSHAKTAGPDIYEVTADDVGNLFCTCTDYKRRKACKHASYVQVKMDNNNGTYPLEISNKATEEEANKAKNSKAELRSFIIKYGKIEVF